MVAKCPGRAGPGFMDSTRVWSHSGTGGAPRLAARSRDEEMDRCRVQCSPGHGHWPVLWSSETLELGEQSTQGCNGECLRKAGELCVHHYQAV
jgi:hypothetical protein